MKSTIKHISLTFVLLALFPPCFLFAQTIPTGSILEQQAKIQILLSDSLTVSPANRPLSTEVYQSLIKKEAPLSNWYEQNLFRSEFAVGNILKTGLYPIFIQNTFNSKFPYGENNQAAWYGRGVNSEFMGGFYLSSKYVTVNIYPHIIYQENIDFLRPRFIPGDGDGNVRYVAEGIGAALDAPFRFGPDPFTTLDLGNSSIRLHYKKLESGFSTEPLWWGPAVRYPLAFSNNAPGIPHFFIGSRQPYSIPYVGDLQFKWILGYPQDSQYYDGEGQNKTRFTTAVNLAYSPIFFKNLTFGIIRVIHLYEENGFNIQNAVLPFNLTSLSSSFNTGPQDRNQSFSSYIHIQLPEANAEIYGEFFREDHSFDVRDFINQPHHNSAYSFGFQKISYIPWVDFLKTNLEFTNLTTSALEQVRFQTFLYTHTTVRQGHTNQGQILGAAIGPGSNSQYLSFDAYKGNYKFGIFAQRWVDNNNFHFERGSADRAPSNQFGDYFRHRVNLNIGLNFLYGPGPFYLNGKFTWTKAFNYGRFDYGDFEGVTVRNYEHKDLINIQFQVGITYIL